MASPSLESLFLRAVNSRRTGGRWSLVVVVGLLVGHLLILGPGTGPAGDRPEETTAPEALPTAVATASEVEGELAGLPRTIRDRTEEIRRDLVLALRADLARLESTVRALRERSAAEPEPEETSPDGAPEIPDEGPTVAERARRDIGSMDWILAIRDAEAGEPLLAALEPVIEERIAMPRFEEARRRWEEDLVSPVRGTLDAAASGISRLRGLAPDRRASWDELTAASRQLIDRALEGSPRLPEDPRWWSSPETEDDESAVPRPETGRVERLLRQNAPPLVEAAEGLHRRAVAVRNDLEVELAATDDESSGQASASEDSELPAGLPLALALVLGALLVARNRADRELVLGAALFVESGGPVAVRDWTLARARISPPRRFSEARPGTGGWWLRGTVAVLAAAAWVALVTLRAAGEAGISPESPAVRAGAAGLVLLILALAHRFVVLGPVLGRLGESADVDDRFPDDREDRIEPGVGAETSGEGTPETGEPEDLEGHPLRP